MKKKENLLARLIFCQPRASGWHLMQRLSQRASNVMCEAFPCLDIMMCDHNTCNAVSHWLDAITWSNAEQIPMKKDSTQIVFPNGMCELSVNLFRPPCVDSSLPGQNGGHFADDVFKCIVRNEEFCIAIKISLKFVPKGPIDNNPALV